MIDDLDPGFSTVLRHEDARIGGGVAVADLDEHTGRVEPSHDPDKLGQIPHTTAGALAGDGDQVAVFVADLPRSGRWQLDYHVPDRHGLGPTYYPSFGALGTFDMTLVADGTETPVVFDGATAETGWNKLGEYEFTGTEVRLEVSSRTEGEMVIADAIRWTPLD
ncbi:MAG: hypothetical protein OXU77_04605 [Gammaproteobacteria bacterium]|nr:hypothetical protein [Gammaproteobacteria bacterium]